MLLLIIDWIMKKTTHENNTSIRWRFTPKHDDLRLYMTSPLIVSSSYRHMQIKTTNMNTFASITGLKINKGKTEMLMINSKCNDRIYINGQELKIK